MNTAHDGARRDQPRGEPLHALLRWLPGTAKIRAI